MIALNKSFIRCLLISLLLAAGGAQAELIMVEQGKVLDISQSHININDTLFRLSPTVKVKKSNNQPGKLIEVRRGNYIEIAVHKIGKRHLVDSIILLK